VLLSFAGKIKADFDSDFKERRWERSGNAIKSMPVVIDFGSLEIA